MSIGFNIGALGYAYWATFRRGVAELHAENRARVREAERELERALREPFVPRPGNDSAALGRTAEGRTFLTLSDLWALTHRRLDLYHDIALGQAKQSFRNAQIAMMLGFTLLVAFVVIALKASSTTGSIVAGGLGVVAAGLSGYVSKTFIRSQEASAGHLRAYFDQPLEFSRYLAAERLIADINLSEESRAEVLTVLVQGMITGSPNVSTNSSQVNQAS